jgi:hypothetical protein
MIISSCLFPHVEFVKRKKKLTSPFYGANGSDKVCFGKSSSFLSKSKEKIFDQIDEAVENSENFLGAGSEAEVYKIPNTDYCVRLPYGTKDPIYKLQYSKDISIKEKINHAVAKLGGGASIMKYIPGFTYCSSEAPMEKVAEMIDEMPQQAFDKLLHQVNYASEHGMYFDTGYRNIIIDPIKKEMTAIDFGSSISPDLLNGIYCALTPHATNMEHRKICGMKVITAGLNELKPKVKPNVRLEELSFDKIVSELQFRGVFASTAIKNVFLDNLNKIKELKLQEIRGIDTHVELNGSFKVVNSLIRQILH